VVIVLPNNEHHRATDTEGDQRTPGEEILRKKCDSMIQVQLQEE